VYQEAGENYRLLAECPQCYCDEIRRMFTFHINIYFPRAYHRPDHSIHIVEYHSKKLLLLNSTSSPGLEPTTGFGFINFAPFFSPQKQTILYWFPSSIVLSYQSTETIFTGTRAQGRFSESWPLSSNLLFETNNFCLCAVLLSCLVS
jgi:hypothetical protein